MTDDEELKSLRKPPLLLRWWLPENESFLVVRLLLLRLLGGVYFITFLGTLLQGRGLIGEHGLLPMRSFLRAVHRQGGPTLFWINDSDTALMVVAGVGCLLSLSVLVVGVTNAAVMIALWIIQLSIYNVGQIFWGYGWEIQLLETGMLAAFVCPLRTWRPFASEPPRVVIWLFRWLIIRIMLGAGLIKLRGDPCWRDLTCLVFHYETQPNPSPLSSALHQMPAWFHTIGVLFNHLVELIAPLLVLGPQGARRIAGLLFITFQAVLIASGNLSFLNWLTIVPAIACFDDDNLVVPKRFRPRAPPPDPSTWHRRFAIGYAAIVGILSIGPTLNLFSSRQAMNASFDPLHLVNTYGAFGTVSRTRDEIILEGSASDDGDDWQEYELPCKPGDVRRRPCLVSPYHYRLDWQMWFAAMSSYDDEPWIVELVDRLLRGDHVIEPLLAKNPFLGAPPRRIRARLFRYEFAKGDPAAWWTRRYVSEYMRPVSLNDPELARFLRAHRWIDRAPSP